MTGTSILLALLAEVEAGGITYCLCVGVRLYNSRLRFLWQASKI